ncbi:hypothetical protein [Sphingosinicella sp.]|uniref:hypothetical protein n=1 Tax=Sphingosinicella sp. TaxID=1917971 RepID=UPI0040384676
MKPRPALAIPLAAAAFAASGCAPEGTFPSLAMRPEERLVTVGEPRRPRADPASDAALRGRASALLAQGRSGTRAFDQAEPAAERAARNAGAMGSETWVSAQQQLSRLEAARAETTTALAELDRLATSRAAEATNSADYAFIEEAKAELERIGAAQQVRLDRLRSRVRS